MWEAVAAIAAAGSALAAGIGTGLNYSNQLKNYAYSSWLQRAMFLREDTAAQRRTWDLRAAGLSPTLAAGSAAGAGPVVKTEAPQMDTQALNMLGLVKMARDISMTEAQEQLIRTQTYKASMEAQTKQWDLGLFMDAGTPSNASGVVKAIRDAIDFFNSNKVQRIKQNFKDKANSYIDNAEKQKKEYRNANPNAPYFQVEDWLRKKFK